MRVNSDIMAALWSLKNDADHAYRQGLNGENPDIHTIGRTWKQLEQAVMQEDAERRRQLEELAKR